MKTLTIALSLLLVVLPAGAQQITAAPSPNFYVAYGVRDAPAQAPAPDSSSSSPSPSSDMRIADPLPQSNPQAPCQCRRHRRAYRRYGPGYGPPTPSVSAGAVIAGLAAVGVALIVIATVHD